MADVQPEHGYTKIADELLEAMAKVKLSPTQYRLIFIIWRYTYGFHRKSHELSLSFFEQATGLDIRNIRRELKDLAEKKIIFQHFKSGEPRSIKFNKDYDQWSMGETTHGLIDPWVKLPKGGLTQVSMGEMTHTTMGEIAQEERDILNTNINTVSKMDDDIMKRSIEVEKHYCMKRGIRDASSTDFQEIKILMENDIPVDFVKQCLDEIFQNYTPKYKGDQIRRFSYCATAIYDKYYKLIQKNAPVPIDKKRGTSSQYRGQRNKPLIMAVSETNRPKQERLTKDEYRKLWVNACLLKGELFTEELFSQKWAEYLDEVPGASNQ